MAQMTWRTSDELLDRVRRQAQLKGRSLNDWVTTVLTAATDPGLSGDEAQQVRERLAAAGLLEPVESGPHRRPEEAEVARARAAAGRGVAASDLVADGRR